MTHISLKGTVLSPFQWSFYVYILVKYYSSETYPLWFILSSMDYIEMYNFNIFVVFMDIFLLPVCNSIQR